MSRAAGGWIRRWRFAVLTSLVAAGGSSLVVAALLAAPQLVSPVGLVEQRCPTFSWSSVPKTTAYELVVYAVSAEGEVGEDPILSARLPGGATSWTAPGASCLLPGDQHAWSLRAIGNGRAGDWATPAVFEVVSAPVPADRRLAPEELPKTDAVAPSRQRASEHRALGTPPAPTGSPGTALPVVPQALRSDSAAAAPSLGTPSLRVTGNIALGPNSNIFKDETTLLWDDGFNLALGRSALISNTTGLSNTAIGLISLSANTTGTYNTAIGVTALFRNLIGSKNTAAGARALFANQDGSFNTATGYRALSFNISGYENTASGYRALEENWTGGRNTAFGARALQKSTGIANTALGQGAGYNATTGNDNIFIGNLGTAPDTNLIRIGSPAQNQTFIAGIRGRTTGLGNAVAVLIDGNGQLGTASSSRQVKQDVRDVGELSKRLLELRPVAFRYKQHVASDPDAPLEFGLIAEEVAAVFPELVVRDAEGRPETVKYHLLSALLLNELQREHEAFQAQSRQLAALSDRLSALERSWQTATSRRRASSDRALGPSRGHRRASDALDLPGKGDEP